MTTLLIHTPWLPKAHKGPALGLLILGDILQSEMIFNTVKALKKTLPFSFPLPSYILQVKTKDCGYHRGVSDYLKAWGKTDINDEYCSQLKTPISEGQKKTQSPGI